MFRTIVIGDIHGALKALKQVMKAVAPAKEDRLIFMGDFVDGWSESAQTVDYLMELDVLYDCIFIRGNHDVWCEQWLSGQSAEVNWLIHGGQATIMSYAGYSPEQKEMHRSFLKRLNNYFVDEKNRLFVHAGFTSMHGPENEQYETNFYWDRTLWEMARVMNPRVLRNSKLYPKRLLHFHEIYIGHTPTTNYDKVKPMKACNVWNVDTGAAFMGKLSALDADSKQTWQSKPVYQLYPNEKGRNS